MTIAWCSAHPNLQPAVIGFVERAEEGRAGPAVEMPFATPVIHVPIDDLAAVTKISTGLRSARSIARGPTGRMFVIALRFTGAHRLASSNLDAAVDSFLPLDAPLWSRLQRKLVDSADFEARVGIAQAALHEFLARRIVPRRSCLAAADVVVSDRFAGSVAQLAARFGLEERTLRNQFRHELGWTPKRLLRVARFNRLVRAIHPSPWGGRHAHDARLEFHDEAHLYHEFRALTGMSPRAFVEAKSRDGDALLHSVSLPANM